MALKNLFRITKEKIITDIVLAFFFVIVILFSWGLNAFLAINPLKKLISFIISLIFSLVVYYPLSCSLVFIYRRITKKKEKEKPTKADMIIAILLILILNPFTIGFFYSGMHSFNNKVVNQPCGVEVTGFAENSPAQNAGISVGEIITAVDGNRVDTTVAFINAITSKKPNDFISLTTNIKIYNVQLIEDTQSHKAVLGIKVKDAYCKR